MLAVEGLTSGYGNLEVVHEVSLSVAAGAITALVGSNGAGKTTLLQTLMGITRARAGSVALDGIDLTPRSVTERARAGIALVPEGRDVFPGLSVRENIELGAYCCRDEAAAGLERMLELFPALRSRQLQAAGSLSGGEQQMVAIARALISQPKVLLLDEPSLGLGPKVVEALFEVVASLRELGTAVLLVEQNVKVALAVAEHGFVMERGRIALSGPADDLAADERVARFYLGTLSSASRPAG
jgi:branched-chain amino acid transport system ATP-binding protein